MLRYVSSWHMHYLLDKERDLKVYGDHLRCHYDKASCIPFIGRIPSMVGLGQSLKELGSNDMGRVS